VPRCAWGPSWPDFMDTAPYFSDLAQGPQDAYARWLKCEDDVRIRVGLFPLSGAKGTIVLFPGRTEFIEKYARVAGEYHARGFAVVAIDWRGQGLADRIAGDPDLGHVGRGFSDYQFDVAAVMDAVRSEALPTPFFVIGHSMGGAIGLRTLIERKDFAAAAFSGPMWGIAMSPMVRPVAWLVPRLARAMGMSQMFLPGVQRKSYVATAEFEGNTLTTDRSEFDAMQRQVRHDPQFALGGPSVHWLHEALRECKVLGAAQLPDVPSIAAIGENEAIVDTLAIKALAQRWPSCTLKVYERAQHELMMERPEVRTAFLDRTAAHFSEHAG